MGVSSFQVELEVRGSAQKTPTPALALSTQVHADLWNKRLGHKKSHSMELIRKRDGSGGDFMGTLSDCDMCHVNTNL